MGRRQRKAAALSGAVRKTVGINEPVSTSAVSLAAKATATKVAYARFVTGKDGWLAWTEAQGVSSTGLDEHAADRVAQFLYFRTSALSLGVSTAGQLLAAICQYHAEATSCGKGAWAVIAREGEASSTAGNPVHSTAVKDMRNAHKQAKVRAGVAEIYSVDVIEPVHIRRFFRAISLVDL